MPYEEKLLKNSIYLPKKKMLLADVLGYDCNFIAKEKLKHIVSKEAFKYGRTG